MRKTDRQTDRLGGGLQKHDCVASGPVAEAPVSHSFSRSHLAEVIRIKHYRLSDLDVKGCHLIAVEARSQVLAV